MGSTIGRISAAKTAHDEPVLLVLPVLPLPLRSPSLMYCTLTPGGGSHAVSLETLL